MSRSRSAPELTEAVLNSEGFPHLYLHLPFCRHKCGYCDFNAYAGLDGLMEPYVAALERELEFAASSFGFSALSTVYLGGGTPSLLPPRLLQRALGKALSLFELTSEAEVTLEANPASTDPERLAAWRNAGVNRLSLGVQGFDPRALAVLERRTDGSQATRAVRQARAEGFDNLSLDLIYGVPYQTLDSWRQTLVRALELEPEHLSCYCLGFEEGTPLHVQLQQGKVAAVGADSQWEFLDLTVSTLEAAGYVRYEVSSWARPGRESRHNRAYWRCRPVYGAGCGAHSYLPSATGARRWWNVARPAEYIRSGTFCDGFEDLDEGKAAAERIMLGLRSVEGLVPPAGFTEVLARLENAGLLRYEPNGRVVPTRRGLDLHSQVALAVL